MTIAVFAYLSAPAAASNALRLQELLAALVGAKPQQEILLCTNVPASVQSWPQSITVFVAKPVALPFGRRLLLRKWRRLAAKKGAQVILYFGLDSFTKNKSYGLLYLPEEETGNRFLATHRRILQKANKLLVTSAGEQEAVATHTGRPAADIEALPATSPVAESRRDLQAIKEVFTGGCDYFLYYGPLSDADSIIRLLKAFSRFKHRQKSSWKLVLLKGLGPASPALLSALHTYKYRDEVVLLQEPAAAETEALLLAAYAFVYPAKPVHYGRYLLAALAARLPVIATAASKDWLPDAALFIDAPDEDNLASALMQLYKDEVMHAQLSAASAARSAAFLPERLTDAWNKVLAAVPK